MDRGEVEVHKLAKKERGQYPAILTEQTWSIKDLLYGFRGDFACRTQRVVPSGQDGAILPARDYPLYPALATRAGKMEPSCPLGTTRCIPQAKFHQKPYNKSFIDQVCSVKMAGYWPRSFFASLWTSTSSRSINTQKKNLANIQPS